MELNRRSADVLLFLPMALNELMLMYAPFFFASRAIEISSEFYYVHGVA
jgi:hypothetical protein